MCDVLGRLEVATTLVVVPICSEARGELPHESSMRSRRTTPRRSGYCRLARRCGPRESGQHPPPGQYPPSDPALPLLQSWGVAQRTCRSVRPATTAAEPGQSARASAHFEHFREMAWGSPWNSANVRVGPAVPARGLQPYRSLWAALVRARRDSARVEHREPRHRLRGRPEALRIIELHKVRDHAAVSVLPQRAHVPRRGTWPPTPDALRLGVSPGTQVFLGRGLAASSRTRFAASGR